MEYYREKFKHAPLGRWNTAFDFGPWPTDAWEFHADGTGKIFGYAGSGDRVTNFEWQEHAERTIRFRETGQVEPPEIRDKEDDEEPME